MSIELKITGTEPLELYQQLGKMFFLLSVALKEVGGAIPQPAPVPQQAIEDPEMHGPATAEELQAHAEKPIATSSGDVHHHHEGGDDALRNTVAGDAMDGAAPPAERTEDAGAKTTRRGRRSTKTEPTEFTMQMMLDRVKAIIDANIERGFDRPTCVEYVRKLFAKFPFDKERCVRKVVELKPPQFADFWRESQAYLDGSAE